MTEKATKETLDALVAQGTTVVDFWASWCTPCHVLTPRLAQLEQEITALKVVTFNVEEDQTLPQTLGIQSIPTMVLYHNGKPIEKISGVYPTDKLRTYFLNKLEAYDDQTKKG